MSNSCNPAGLSICLCVTRYYRSCGAGLLYHVKFQEIHTRRRKEFENKHHGTVQELTSEQQRFSRTEITFLLKMNGGYIRSGLGSRSVLVVRLAGWEVKILLFTEFSKSCNLPSNAYFWADESVSIDVWLDFGEIIITRLFSQAYFSAVIVFLVEPYY